MKNNKFYIYIIILIIGIIISYILISSLKLKNKNKNIKNKFVLQNTYSESYFPNEIGVVTLNKLPIIECNPIKNDCDNGINCNSPITKLNLWFNNTEYNNVNVKIHGNVTSTWEKKSYNIKFNVKTKLVDYIPISKDYILYSPYYELNKYQNVLSYYLSNSINFIAPKCYPVFLWINENGPEKTIQDWINYNNKTTLPSQLCNNQIISGGDKPFRGIYWLINKIDENMLNLKQTDYLIQFDRGLCCKDANKLIKNFSPFGFNMYNKASLLGWSRPIIEFAGKNVREDPGTILTKFVENLFSDTDEPSEEAINMIDFESWAKYFILSELFNSVDAYLYSTNMSLRYDDNNNTYKIFMGPLWDYNQAFCNCSSYTPCRDGGNPKFWKYAKQWFTFKYNSKRYCVPEFYARILMSSQFRKYVVNMYQTLRTNELSNNSILNLCYKFKNLIRTATNNDLYRWNNYFGNPIQPDNDKTSEKTYWNISNFWFNYLEECIKTRLEWLDQNMKNGPNIDTSGNNSKNLNLEFGKNIPPNQDKNNYNGDCIIDNNFSECDVQNNTGFFYAK